MVMPVKKEKCKQSQVLVYIVAFIWNREIIVNEKFPVGRNVVL